MSAEQIEDMRRRIDEMRARIVVGDEDEGVRGRGRVYTSFPHLN